MNDRTAIIGLYAGWALGFVMLGVAVSGRHPYGFYVLLRWIACAVFVYSVFAALRFERPVWMWLFGVDAMLFNPFVPIHFSRGVWQAVDWLALASILAAAVVFSKHLRAPQSPP